MHATTGPGDATEIARKYAFGDADLILVAGGDGTINEALNGMIGSTVPMAPLPAGTANVLCMELGLGNRMERVAARIDALKPVRLSTGLLRNQCGSRHFLLMGGIGLDAQVVNNLHAGLKRATGKFAYWVAGFGMVARRLSELDVVVNGTTTRCSFALASRVRNYGGDLTIARNASLLCNDFELVMFAGRTAFRYLPYLTAVLLRAAHVLPGVTILRGREIELRAVESGPVYIQIDGELAGTLPARIEIVDDAVTLLMPAEYV